MLTFKTGCMIIFLVGSNPPEPQQWAAVKSQDPAVCQGILMAAAIATDPANEKKLEELETKPSPSPEEPAK